MSESWYRLSHDDKRDPKKKRLTVIQENFFGVDYVDLQLGMRIDVWNQNSTFRSASHERDGVADDLLDNSCMLPIFSNRLQTALREEKIADADIQYLPLHIYQSTGEGVPGYHIANVISRVPALNRAKSVKLDENPNEIDPLTGQSNVTGIWTAALKAEILEGHDIIRLLEFWPPVFVSERFVEIFQTNNFTGASFKQVPVYDKDDRLISGPPQRKREKLANPLQEKSEDGYYSFEYYQAFYRELFAPLEETIGPVDKYTLGAIVGFDAGGPINLSTIGRHSGGRFVTYITCELASRPDQKPSQFGRYEVLMSCDDQEWAQNVLTAVGQTTLEETLDEGHTLDISACVKPSDRIRGVIFEHVCSVEIEGEEYGILRAIGITEAEMKYAREHSPGALTDRLKEADVYPNTATRRRSVI